MLITMILNVVKLNLKSTNSEYKNIAIHDIDMVNINFKINFTYSF